MYGSSSAPAAELTDAAVEFYTTRYPIHTFLITNAGKRDRFPVKKPQINLKGVHTMPVFFATIGAPLAAFAEGALLAASVYLVSRGVKNPFRNKKK